MLNLLLAGNSIIYVLVRLVVKQIVSVVFTCKRITLPAAAVVLCNALLQVIGHTGIQYSPLLIGKNVDVVAAAADEHAIKLRLEKSKCKWLHSSQGVLQHNQSDPSLRSG